MPIISKVFLLLTTAQIIRKSVEPHLHVVNGEALPQLDVTPISGDLKNIWSSKGICVHGLYSPIPSGKPVLFKRSDMLVRLNSTMTKFQTFLNSYQRQLSQEDFYQLLCTMEQFGVELSLQANLKYSYNMI